MPQKKRISPLFRVIKYLVWLFYPKMEVVGKENLPEGEAIIVANHAQMNGPIACELYLPENRYTWCAGQMMNWREVPSYAYKDFWVEKPKYSRPFYKLLSYVIAPLAHFVFNQANTIAVYRDNRILTTFRTTIKKLEEGARIVIFPEHKVPLNHILCDFQDKFVDVARIYHSRTGKKLSFVPMYIAPELKKMCLGRPLCFSAENPIEKERRRICDALMTEITRIATHLPPHTVIPYQNIPKKNYPINILQEVTLDEANQG